MFEQLSKVDGHWCPSQTRVAGWREVFRSFRKAYPSLPDEIICRILRMPPEYLAYVPESNQEGKKDTGLKLEDSSSLKEGSKR